jgi:hypothetical protein
MKEDGTGICTMDAVPEPPHGGVGVWERNMNGAAGEPTGGWTGSKRALSRTWRQGYNEIFNLPRTETGWRGVRRTRRTAGPVSRLLD